jgi:putative ABC transport system permease protein
MLKLAFRNIFRQWMRTSLTLLAIATGVGGLILSGGFVEDVFVQLGEATIHSQLGHLQIANAGRRAGKRSDPYKFMIDDPDRVKGVLDKLPHVVETTQRISFSGLVNNGRGETPVLGEGVEPEKEARLGTSVKIIAGRQMRDDDSYGVLLGQGVAERLSLKPGDRVTILLNTTTGALNTLEFTAIGVFQSFSKDYDARAVRIDIRACKELLDTPSVHSVVVLLDDTKATDSVVAAAKGLLPATFEVMPWYELDDFYPKTVELYRRQFGILQLIVLVMVLLSVANTINMAIHDRIGEFGTMMALGNRAGFIFRMIVLESAVLGVIGAVLGVALGVVLAATISFIGIPMPPPPNSSIGYTAAIQIRLSVIGTAFVIGVVAAIVAAVLPARRVSSVPVVEALRQN